MKKLCVLLFVLSLFSCQREFIKSEKGGIDIISNIYFNASQGLNNVKSILVSKINYKNDTIIEFVPYVEIPDIIEKTHIITDTIFFDVTHIENNQIVFSNLAETIGISQKRNGAIFSNDRLLNFNNRRKIEDTILFNKSYKRFEINSPEHYSVYYIYPTDTILPYKIYPKESQKYSGRIERIDTYHKRKDIFISVQLFPRKNWDEEAKNIFEFNEFIQKRKQNKYE